MSHNQGLSPKEPHSVRNEGVHQGQGNEGTRLIPPASTSIMGDPVLQQVCFRGHKLPDPSDQLGCSPDTPAGTKRAGYASGPHEEPDYSQQYPKTDRSHHAAAQQTGTLADGCKARISVRQLNFVLYSNKGEMTAGHVYFVVWKIPHENYMSCRVFGGGM